VKRSAMMIVVMAVSVLTACGDDDQAVVDVQAPEGATFCSVYEGEYQTARDGAVPITESGFAEAGAEIVAWARVLASLAPAEITDLAAANLGYHEAQLAVQSASDFIPGSNDMHAWARANC